MIFTLNEFVAQARRLNSVRDAYELFEDQCSDELRKQIYSIADTESPEPFRDAMNKLGFVNY